MSNLEQNLRTLYGAKFEPIRDYLDEGNDKGDLILMVMELKGRIDESREQLVKEVEQAVIRDYWQSIDEECGRILDRLEKERGNV